VSRTITRYEAKPIATSTTFLAACFAGSFSFYPICSLLLFDMLHVWLQQWLAGIRYSCFGQLPKYRATLFSLNSLAVLLEGSCSTNWRSTAHFSSEAYGSVGLVLGQRQVCGCLILFFAVKDSNRYSGIIEKIQDS
jgi:hypothetical protein